MTDVEPASRGAESYEPPKIEQRDAIAWHLIGDDIPTVGSGAAPA
jgi:hypothetical protein